MTTLTAADLKLEIEAAWEARDGVSTATQGPVRTAVQETLNLLDAGRLRVAERGADRQWTVQQWVKQAILLSFRLSANSLVRADTPGPFWDKVPLKFAGWEAADFEAAGLRAVPGCVVRHSAYVARNVVLMPSFVNVGAHVDEGTMVDTWATIGSCAQIGKNCHISGGAGIGGVLEPLQANPTIIEDNCFIGARAEVAEGVIVREGSVISMGVFLTATTPIIDRRTGVSTLGEIPPYSVVVSGARPSPHEGLPSTYCAVIMKTVDERTRAKTSVNELLRD
ncbi:2,3,4,5-tetrahydropyridine-2,6-dicarboxylate N-succinyltransferase [Phenylobacterium sp.]|jgi:2,3,4,5-tetrahydropyridine-2-carboxylate N-succinyltransferase|uniref:2,3,4,5-tetrahydropyridine-2,6-dicarboxylate N-succinyltransferase n=1 Tax=Phenylobacterium sp. TaxID=1871053 RepID=UPI002F3F35E5